MWHQILLTADPIYLVARQCMRRVRAVVQQLIRLEVSLDALPTIFAAPRRVKAINVVNTTALVFLVPQLIGVSDPGAAGNSWMAVGWILETWFWVDMTLRAAAMGFRKHLKYTFGVPFAVNMASLVLMAMVQRDMYSSGRDLLSIPFLSLLIVQCSRFISFLGILSDANNVTAVAPLFIRVTFIIFCWIYIFAVFGHNRFCNMLRPEEAANNDDVAPNWIPYEHQLNFHTFASSMYTMFEIATFGDWSVVQVAAKVSPVSSYLFFYTYRFIMSLIILPIMSSFIIQAFITRSDSSSTPVGADSKAGGEENLAETGDATTIQKSTEGGKYNGGENDVDDNGISGMNGTRDVELTRRVIGGGGGGGTSERSHSDSSLPENKLQTLKRPTNGAIMKLFQRDSEDGDEDEGSSASAGGKAVKEEDKREKVRRSRVFEDLHFEQSSRISSGISEPIRRNSHTGSISSSNFIPMTTQEFDKGGGAHEEEEHEEETLESQTSKSHAAPRTDSSDQPVGLRNHSGEGAPSMKPPPAGDLLMIPFVTVAVIVQTGLMYVTVAGRRPIEGKRRSTHTKRASFVGAKASPSEMAGSSMISFWSNSGTGQKPRHR
jgi:hypothetical protein